MDPDLDVKYISMEVADDVINLYTAIWNNIVNGNNLLTYSEARNIAMSAVPEAMRRLGEKRKERERIHAAEH